MTKTRRIPDFIWRWMKPLNQRLARRYSGNAKFSELVILVTTIGRKSGLPRVTPLQHEEMDGVMYIASAKGVQADWFQDILANPQVEVQHKDHCFKAHAEAITDPNRIADFLELRIKRRPRMIKTLLRIEGLPARFDRAQLEAFAAEKALVALHPIEE